MARTDCSSSVGVILHVASCRVRRLRRRGCQRARTRLRTSRINRRQNSARDRRSAEQNETAQDDRRAVPPVDSAGKHHEAHGRDSDHSNRACNCSGDQGLKPSRCGRDCPRSHGTSEYILQHRVLHLCWRCQEISVGSASPLPSRRARLVYFRTSKHSSDRWRIGGSGERLEHKDELIELLMAVW